jgi:hypothetical protein
MPSMSRRRSLSCCLGVAARPETVTAWRGLITSMQGLPRAEQLGKVIEFLDKVRDIGQKKIVLQAFGLPPEFANLTTKELQAAIEEIRSRLKPITADDIVKGRKAADAIDDLKESLQSLRDAIGGGFAEDLAQVARSMADFVSANSDEAIKTLRELAQGIGLVVKALDDLRNSKPVDMKALIDFTGLDRTFETFTATWRARWEQFKASIGVGDQHAADAAEAERRRLLKKDFPEQLEREDRERQGPQRTLPGGYLIAPPSISPERIMPPGPAKPAWWELWKRSSFEGPAFGGAQLTRAAYQDGGFNTPSRSDAERMLSGAVEKGVYDGLVDFARGEGPGGAGGGGGGGMGAIKAAFSPSSTGGFSSGGGYTLGGPGAGTGEPSAGGAAGTGGGVASSPMGSLPGASPAYPTTLDQLGGGAPGKGDPRGVLSAVRQAAIRHGINPDVMERVARSEGLGAFRGDGGTSFGAMQLHRGGRGSVGTEFERETGLNLADPKNERAAIDYAAGWAAKHGWGAWMGAAKQGIRGRMGIGVDTSRWSHELNMKPPHFSVGDIRERLQGAGIAAPVGTGSADVGSALREGSAASGVDLPHLKAMASIESSFNPNSNYNRRTQYKGLFQIGRSEWAEYLQHGGKGSIYNARDNAMAMAYLVNRNRRAGRYGLDDDTKAAVALHGDALRHHFGVGQRSRKIAPDLLGSARAAGLVGEPLRHKVEGSAHLKIDVTGPRGTQAKMAKMDGIFKPTEINRGRAMPLASQTG